MNKNELIVNEVAELLTKEENKEWEEVYAGYAEKVLANASKYVENSKGWNLPSSVSLYCNLSMLMSDSLSVSYDLRYSGQSIGCLKVDSRNHIAQLEISEKQAEYARKNWGFEESKHGTFPWNSQEAEAFRKFYDAEDTEHVLSVQFQEHKIEDFFLREFCKESTKHGKMLSHIQPICLQKIHFKFTTGISASRNDVKISFISDKKGVKGGAIDIFARVLHNSPLFKLAIIELKDENKESEPQEKVMFQALRYATFIAYLLRSKSGKKWYNIFREKYDINEAKDVPEHLDIDVVTLMPVGNSKEGDLLPIELEDLNTTLHLYTLYYDKDENGAPKSFSGTFVDALRK